MQNELKRLMFQVYFLNKIGRPNKMSVKDILERYVPKRECLLSILSTL